MIAVYIWVSTGVLIAIGLAWSKRSYNLLIKLALIGVGVWGLYCAFTGL
jgi:hypothetical protein